MSADFSAPDAVPPTAESRAEMTAAQRQQGVVQLLRVVYRAMQDHSRQIEKAFGVSAAQLAALWALSEQPGARVSGLSQTLALHQSTTSNMLDKLEKKGLVERHRGGPDQRVVQVFISAAGQQVLQRAPRPGQDAISAALTRLPNTELLQLQRSLMALIARMDSADREAALRDMTDGL